MSWFLVLLFWNPVTGGFTIPDGWSPRPAATYEICERRRDYVKRYISKPLMDAPHVVECVQAKSLGAAIKKAEKMI